MASLKYWLWLTTRKGLSNVGVLGLLDHFGTPEAAYFADPAEYDLVPGLTGVSKGALLDRSMGEPERILAECDRLGHRILTFGDAGYPERLRNIYDPPAVLYLQGRDISFDDQVAIGVIGAREPTAYGIAQAQRLGYDLAAQGAVVVSGLARGLDSEGLRGALRGGGTVCAVLGCGLDVIYPRENRFLYQDVAAAGLLISEYPPGTEARRGNFPARNRIISGLSLGVVVVEGGYPSGTQITARAALDQNRDVFAVPGPVDAPMSYTPNLLIRRGEAMLVTSASDILQEYQAMYPNRIKLKPGLAPDTPAIAPGVRPRRPEAAEETAFEDFAVTTKSAAVEKRVDQGEEIPYIHWKKLTPALTDDQRDVLLALREKELVMDEIIDATQIPTRRCTSAVVMLQLAGFVSEEAGKRFAATVRIYTEA